MRIPRDLSAKELIKLLSKYGYVITRQKGSHIRLSRVSTDGEHHLTIPNHNPLRIGTLNSIITEAADKLNITRDELLSNL